MTRTMKPDKGAVNRTGMSHSVHAHEMSESTRLTEPTEGDGGELLASKRRYIEEAPMVGSLPPPDSELAEGDPAAARKVGLMDKIGERLAFERTGTRLYDALLVKLDAEGSFPGGPERSELEEFRNQELEHFLLLEEAIESLGGDPTAVTPSADVSSVVSMGVGVTIGDARTSLAQGLQAILAAELIDNEGWNLLVRLSRELGQEELARSFEHAKEEEERHLESVREWVSAHTLNDGA